MDDWLRSRRYDVADAFEANELFPRNGWTDGLPVVPPTEDRGRQCLAAARRAPDDTLGTEPVRLEPDHRLTALGGELYRVVDEVRRDLVQKQRVAPHRDRGMQPRFEPDALGLRARSRTDSSVRWRRSARSTRLFFRLTLPAMNRAGPSRSPTICCMIVTCRSITSSPRVDWGACRAPV